MSPGYEIRFGVSGRVRRNSVSFQLAMTRKKSGTPAETLELGFASKPDRTKTRASSERGHCPHSTLGLISPRVTYVSPRFMVISSMAEILIHVCGQ